MDRALRIVSYLGRLDQEEVQRRVHGRGRIVEEDDDDESLPLKQKTQQPATRTTLQGRGTSSTIAATDGFVDLATGIKTWRKQIVMRNGETTSLGQCHFAALAVSMDLTTV
jgi:hypothetical protein